MAFSSVKIITIILLVIYYLDQVNGVAPSTRSNEEYQAHEVTGYEDDQDVLQNDGLGNYQSTAAGVDISCPHLCACYFHDSIFVVDCEGLNFTSVPDDIPVSTNSLMLSYNQIVRIQRRVFQKLVNIKSLSLQNNNLSFIHVNSFSDLTTLVFLDLSGNSLGDNLPNSLFSDLTNLKILNLSANGIRELPNGTLQDLSSLTDLDLSNNHIHELGEDFLNLLELQYLDLSHNEVEITHNTFSNCSNLTRLYLRANNIDTVPPNAFVNLINLRELDISFNRLEFLDNNLFVGLESLEKLTLQNNQIKLLSDAAFSPLHKLEYVNISGNFLTTVSGYPFASNQHLKILDMSRMPYLNSVEQNAFRGLVELEQLFLGDNPQLASIHPDAFQCLHKLKELDISNCNLSTLEKNILSSLPSLQKFSAYGNSWLCDCSMHWLLNLTEEVEIIARENMTCSQPENVYDQSAWDFENLNCSAAVVFSHLKYVKYKVGSSALLECDVAGDPLPFITWVTPNMGKFRWYPSYMGLQSPTRVRPDSYVSGSCNAKANKPKTKRIQVLDNGNLYITDVQSADIGHYTCIAANHLGSANTTISFLLDFKIINEVKVVSMLVGLATAIIFTFIALLVQFIYMAINRWGLCCCCEGYVSPKTKQIRSILEGVEQYRSQQLERLRENYNAQVQRIKDNCTQQVEKIRDSYSADKLKDIRDYSTQHLSNIRDNYYDQVKKVRDYSAQQLNKVRENYILQRNRVRKFSTHQMIKLRENYKVQQLHLNKILENLNMESCRTTCGRTDSIMFDSDETLGPLFPDPFHKLGVSLGMPPEHDFMPYRMDDVVSRDSQYFTPVDSNSICEGEDTTEDLPRLSEESALSRTICMVDKCVGTSTIELNIISRGNEPTKLSDGIEQVCQDDTGMKQNENTSEA